jgi:subtilisin family serine protease
MPTSKRPNPSILVVELKGKKPNLHAISDQIRELAGDTVGGGNALTKLSNGSYAVPRTLSKKLRVGHHANTAADIVEAISAVENARFEKANEIKTEYENHIEPHRSTTPTNPNTAGIPSEQWNLKKVRAEQGWGLLGNDPSNLDYRNVAVGHIDTGVAPHPALGFGADGTSPFVLVDEGQNYIDAGNSLPQDPLGYKGQPGHGTRTMSVLAARAPGEMMGVAPGVTVVPYRITNSVVIDELGNDTLIERAISHAVNDRNCQVLSISLGDPCFPPSKVGLAVDDAYEQGTIIVAAAGNITSEVTYPGRYSRTIAVGGISKNDRPWSGGSQGRKVDLCAPADDVFRALVSRDGSGPFEFGYSAKDGDGTSYATTHVSGAAALWLAYHHDKLPSLYLDPWQRVEAFRSVLHSSARKPNGWNTRLLGAGILDIEALLKAELPAPDSLRKSQVAERERH